MKFTEETKNIIINSIASGLSKKKSCFAAGIIEKTFYGWLNLGKEAIDKGEDNDYADFYMRVKKAEAAFINKRLANIKRAGEEGSWQADAWLLERCFPEEYGRNKATLELTGNAEKPVEVEQKSKVEIYSVRLPDNGRE